MTHAVLIVGAVSLHLADGGAVARDVAGEVRTGLANPQFGLFGMLALLLHAYSLGAGTYTGIEAVSNSMPVMREPRVATAKRTMLLHGRLAGLHGRRTDARLPAAGHLGDGKARR